MAARAVGIVRGADDGKIGSRRHSWPVHAHSSLFQRAGSTAAPVGARQASEESRWKMLRGCTFIAQAACERGRDCYLTLRHFATARMRNEYS
jgi:hypothetical protein